MLNVLITALPSVKPL